MADPLQFERAEYAPGQAAGPLCSLCKKPLPGEYWQLGQKVLCGNCRAGLEAIKAKSTSFGAFARAFFLAGGVAIGCGIGYAIITSAAQRPFVLITIGIGYVVAKVIRKATYGIGGRRYQLLAVALTYFASTMGYFPAVYGEMTKSADKAAVSKTPRDAEDSPAPEVHGAMKVVLVVVAFFVSLAAPFLGLSLGFDGVWGIFVIAIGLYEAWKLSREIPLAMVGPLRLAPAPPAP